MSRLNIDDIKNRCRYIQIDLPFRGVEDELYNYRRPFDELLEDEDDEFPLANYETQRWVAVLDLQKKLIFGWNSSYGSVRIDAKVRDEGIYTLLDSEMQIICRLEGYVPNGVIPPKDGCGDYIRFEVDDKGRVSSLYDEPDFTEFSDKGILADSEVVNMRNINEVN